MHHKTRATTFVVVRFRHSHSFHPTDDPLSQCLRNQQRHDFNDRHLEPNDEDPTTEGRAQRQGFEPKGMIEQSRLALLFLFFL